MNVRYCDDTDGRKYVKPRSPIHTSAIFQMSHDDFAYISEHQISHTFCLILSGAMYMANVNIPSGHMGDCMFVPCPFPSSFRSRINATANTKVRSLV